MTNCLVSTQSKENETGTPSEKPKRVVLVHRGMLIRESVAQMLAQAGYDVTVFESLPDNLAGSGYIESPDIMLLEWEVVKNPPSVIRGIIERYPQTTVAVFTQSESNGDLMDALSMGVKGYLSFSLSAQEFLQILGTLERGDIVVSRDVACGFLQAIPRETSQAHKDGLSDRELEVLKHIGGGCTNREIAEKLIVSEHTVKVHLRSILNKLSFKNRQQIAAYAAREGLIPSESTDPTADYESSLSQH